MKIKPCPCCGWTPELTLRFGHYEKFNKKKEPWPPTEPMWKIRCDKCGLQTTNWHTKEECLKAWNTRKDQTDED